MMRIFVFARLCISSVLCRCCCEYVLISVFAGSYCPALSSAPIPCPAGYYGTTAGLSVSTCSGACPVGCARMCGGRYRRLTQCVCRTYGATAGLSVATCTGTCQAGYFGSASALTSATGSGARTRLRAGTLHHRGVFCACVYMCAPARDLNTPAILCQPPRWVCSGVCSAR